MVKKNPRRAAGTGDDGWGNVAEAPRLDIPDARRRIILRGLATAWVWLSVIATPVLMLALTSLLVRPDTTAAQASAQQAAVTASDQVAKATAVQRMGAWLSAPDPQLPGGRVLTVDDQVERVDYNTDQAKRDAKRGGTATTTQLSSLHIVHFTLADTVGNLYRSAVSVCVDGTGVVTSVSSPSLDRLPPASNTSGAISDVWPGRTQAQASDSVKQAVKAWAAAYTSGDAAGLRQALGDTDPNHLYVPLPKAAGLTATASAATETAAADPKTPGRQVLAVRVDLTLAWTAQTADKLGQTSSSRELTQTSLDVLVEQADTAAPKVVAWGAPGTGPTLQRFANAIDASAQAQQQRSTQGTDQAPTASASPTATPAGGN